MATRKTAAKPTATTEVVRDSERDKALRKAYQTAEKRLKEFHQDEWTALLEEEYANAGLTVRRRLNEDEKAAKEQEKIDAKRRALLQKLADLDGVPVAVVEEQVTGDPFAA